jgi:hypothetical protein
VEGVVEYLSPSARMTEFRARSAMEQVHINDTGVRNLRITVNRLTNPPTAELQFDGVIRFRFRNMNVGRDFYAARFVVELRLEEGRWLVTEHIEQTPISL